MAATYLPYGPRQMLLCFLKKRFRTGLAAGRVLAHFFSVTVDKLDVKAFHARYEQEGPRN